MTTNNETRLGAVVLAGGRGARMGADKALLTLNGETLLDRARGLVRAAGARDGLIVVAGRPDAPDGIADTRPDAGPAHAARDALAVLAARGATRALIVPVDMPRLAPAVLAPLLAARAPAAAYADQPLPCVVATAPPEGADDAASLFGFLAARGVAWLTPDPAARPALASVNTPEDWRRLTASALRT